MTAEIIELWLHKKGVRRTDPAAFLGNTKACMYQPHLPGAIIDRDCACESCRAFFADMQRTTQEIFRDLAQLHMIGALDEQARNALIAELRATSDF